LTNFNQKNNLEIIKNLLFGYLFFWISDINNNQILQFMFLRNF
jgi:hypothetical protein